MIPVNYQSHSSPINKKPQEDPIKSSTKPHLDNLPEELILVIFKKLNDPSLVKLAATAKHFNHLYQIKDSYWEHKKLETEFNQALKDGSISRYVDKILHSFPEKYVESIFKEKHPSIHIKNYDDFLKFGKLVEQLKDLEIQELQQQELESIQSSRSRQNPLLRLAISQSIIKKISHLFSEILKNKNI